MYFDMQYRVPYADTDQMGVVYYANYLEYFERGRTEMFRATGASYAKMEREGYFLPVAEAYSKYVGSARYDDLLTFRSYVVEYSRVRIKIATEVRRDGEVLVTGYVVLGCVNAEFKITRLPRFLVECCEQCLYSPEAGQ
ncbi:MAG: acyl-CoA thioesterase [Lentisphaeria bacterium]|nr:acyl-CoA thioesterase [Lentisphaeria bacterium]